MICENCGTENNGQKWFCEACGFQMIPLPQMSSQERTMASSESSSSQDTLDNIKDGIKSKMDKLSSPIKGLFSKINQ